MTYRVRIKWDSKAQIYDDNTHYGTLVMYDDNTHYDTLVMYDHKDIKYKINMYWMCDCHMWARSLGDGHDI